MRNTFAAPIADVRLARTPSRRGLSNRRRLAVLGGVLALAAVSGVIGLVSGPRGDERLHATQTGPFSYLTE